MSVALVNIASGSVFAAGADRPAPVALEVPDDPYVEIDPSSVKTSRQR